MKKKLLIISTVGLIYDGITNVIISYLKNMDKSHLEIYVAATIKVEEDIRDDIENMGGIVVDFPSRKSKPLLYMVDLIDFIRRNKIEIIHAHGNSGTLAIEMVAGWLGGCKKRIAHSHNTKCNQVKADKILRPFFNIFYTDALACGEEAGKWLFGNRPFSIIKNGRDIDEFKFNQRVRDEMREKYGVSHDLVIGHVGGFYEQKNHIFLIKIFREILRKIPKAKLVLIGDGPKRELIESSVKDISDNVVFIGTTTKVADYLQMFDGALLPSLFEGVPLVVIEWQINGIPCLLSDVITDECAVTNTIEFLSLDESPKNWAEKIIKMINCHNRYENATESLKKIQLAGFDIKRSCKALEEIYLR